MRIEAVEIKKNGLTSLSVGAAENVVIANNTKHINLLRFAFTQTQHVCVYICVCRVRECVVRVNLSMNTQTLSQYDSRSLKS